MDWIMFPAFSLWIVLCSLYSTTASHTEVTGDANDGEVVMCSVFPGYSFWKKKEIKLSAVNLSKCTHITYPGLEPIDEKPYITYTGQPKTKRELLKMREDNPNLKIIIAFHNDVTSAMSEGKKLAKIILKYLKFYRLDGIMLTGLTPTSSEDREAIADFIKTLKSVFDGTDLLIMFRLSYAYLHSYPIREVKDDVDFILPRPYIYNADSSNPTLHSQPLFSQYSNLSVADTIEYVLEQCVEPRKVLMPLYFQGKQWFVKERTDELSDHEILSLRKTPRFTSIQYRETCHLEKEGWRRIWDEGSKAPLLTEYQSIVSYEDEQSIAEKVKFAKSHSLGGIDIYGPELDEITGKCGKGTNPLSRAAIKELKRPTDTSKYPPVYIKCPQDENDYPTDAIYEDDHDASYDDASEAASGEVKGSEENGVDVSASESESDSRDKS